MGFSVFKVNQLPLVVRCRERKNLLKAAADHRYALAAAHVEYFVGLKDVGEALRKFVHEDLVYTTPSSSSSPTSSPVSETKSLYLTSDSNDDGSHLHFSDDDESEETGYPSGHGHWHGHGHYPGGLSGPAYDSIEQMMNKAHPHRGPQVPVHQAWGPPPPAGHSCRHPTVHYMTTTAPAMRTVIHEAMTEYLYEGFNREAPPPPEGGSSWDFLNVFDGGGSGYHPQGTYGGASGVSSEEETEAEVYTELVKRKKGNRSYYSGNCDCDSGASTSKQPLHKNKDASSKSVPAPPSEQHKFRSSSKREHEAAEHNFPGRRGSKRLSEHDDEGTGSIYLSEDLSSSPETEPSPKDTTEKLVSFSAVDETPEQHPTEIQVARDLREVVAEIRDEFATASGYGIQVAAMLEVGKLPYLQSLFRELLSRIMLRRSSSSSSSSYTPSASARRLAAKTSKLARSYLSNENERQPRSSLSSTLEALYVWEKKLYQEVKVEEKLRLAYEKQCKLLRRFDEIGAESDRIYALRALIMELNTKLKICMKTIGAISIRIHKLRDEVLQPQLAGLIHGMISMWKSIFGCHQKQFEAIMVCEMNKLKANTGFQKESRLRASRELEMELKGWSSRLNDWINSQKSFVQSLNGWLTQCLAHELEETSEVPPIFSMCNDWLQAMEIVSNTGVANAMHTFASSLHQLSVKQDEEQRQRAKARDFIPNEVKNRLRKLPLERGRTKREVDAMCDKTLLSLVLKEKNGAFDELKVDLRKRLAEERAKHKEAVKIVRDAASSSVRGDLVPLFKALEGFSLEALKVHQQVRLKPNCTALFN